ncbi:Radical SAM core domain-containing protein [Frankia sp. AiPs1]|uniref:Rv2578c family radical SAM protein n=1 Tax=Frankia sp. AiPa1 TaxID=573492 RepID=UPI00202B5FBA|nr:Rv2578c family radical SAM protein [Frankia sp. AiPa1]MCL9759685.1 Rv2578c family radical SAM protein [Frankia sp. AiPa1]
MRWSHLAIGDDGQSGAEQPAALLHRGAVARTFDTPEFAGVTFYEIHARSALNRVPPASRMTFRWTVNPYRGCTHACRYCFARSTHRWLDLNAGEDFDTRIVVKVNIAERLRTELAAPRWRGEHVAMGTNVDPYQRGEGRYRLMPGVIGALRDARTPFSLLTKGTLLLRDADLFAEAAEMTDVGVAVSVGFVDEDLWRGVEPGTPAPRRRLAMCAALRERGLRVGVLMAPILPYLTDSPAALAATVDAIADAGAASVTPIVLHLRPGAREWYLAWLAEHHPALVGPYRRLYGDGAYAARSYQQRITGQVRALAERAGIGRGAPRPGPGGGVAAGAASSVGVEQAAGVAGAATLAAPRQGQLALPGLAG